ncbi:hypothetical protein FQZ97_990450 [compost metagenome]
MRVARAQRQVAGGLFRHRNGEINLVWRARHGLCVDTDLGEEAQAVHAIAGQADAVAVVPGRFELAEFAAHDFVARAVVAFDVDAAHIYAPGRLAAHHERDALVDAIDLRGGYHLCEGVSEGAEVIGECLHGAVDVFGVVGLTGTQGHQGLELIFLAQVLALQRHRRHHVAVALSDVQRDRHVLLVRRDGDLR